MFHQWSAKCWVILSDNIEVKELRFNNRQSRQLQLVLLYHDYIKKVKWLYPKMLFFLIKLQLNSIFIFINLIWLKIKAQVFHLQLHHFCEFVLKILQLQPGNASTLIFTLQNGDFNLVTLLKFWLHFHGSIMTFFPPWNMASAAPLPLWSLQDTLKAKKQNLMKSCSTVGSLKYTSEMSGSWAICVCVLFFFVRV